MGDHRRPCGSSSRPAACCISASVGGCSCKNTLVTLVIEFHAGGARFEIAAVFSRKLFVSLFFLETGFKIGFALYMSAHYTWLITVC